MSAAKLIFLALTCLSVNWFGVKRSQGSKEWLDYKEMNLKISGFVKQKERSMSIYKKLQRHNFYFTKRKKLGENPCKKIMLCRKRNKSFFWGSACRLGSFMPTM